jgi:hypothetical protein
MDSGRDTPWRNEFVLARDFRTVGDHSSIYRAVERGALARVATGAYLPAARWSSLDPDQRRLALVDANGLLHPDDGPYCHLSAAALWGLPMIGTWPDRLEVLAPVGIEVRSRRAVQWRYGPRDPGAVMIDGHATTSLARTLVDVARLSRMALGVTMVDYGLSAPGDDATWFGALRVRRGELLEQVGALEGTRGIVRASRVVEFADGASGSAGESVSRVAMHVLGFPAPILQQPFYDADGLIGYCDFWWPELGLVGEFDGRGKYLRDEFTRGRTTAEVVLDEKRRENRLRALGLSVVRWEWADALAPRRLGVILAGAGLRRVRGRTALGA